MKTWIKVTAIALLAVSLTGCASMQNCRFALVDLDLRSPEQMQAQNDGEVSAQTLPPAFWASLMDLLSVLKGRLRVISFEWERAEVSETPAIPVP